MPARRTQSASTRVSPSRSTGKLQAELLEAREEAIEVLVEPEELALPDRHDVIGRVRAQEAEVENRHARLCDRDELAVDVRHACRGVRRHAPMLPIVRRALLP